MVQQQKAIHRVVCNAILFCLLVQFAVAPALGGVSRLRAIERREVVSGVTYVQYLSNGKRPIRVHAVVFDRTTPGLALRVIKAQGNNTGRERLKDMAVSYEAEAHADVLALVNANFWSAGRSTPIGPCVVDGEIVEMLPYKHWSSAFLDFEGRVTIDSFQLRGVIDVDGITHDIGSVNRRVSDTTLVVYNSFAGEAIPNVSPALIEHLYAEMMKDSVQLQGDSTERAIDTVQVRLDIAKAQIESNLEHSLQKIQVEYLRQPSLNAPIPCKVLANDTGTVSMPANGCMISLPRGYTSRLPQVNDTLTLRFETNVNASRRYMNAVCGTPRIVRNGKARSEAANEGVTGRRFIKRKLARTCLGVDKSGSKIILAAIEPTVSSKRQTGATLAEAAQIMRLLGSYQAMNLDGGGSTGMVVQHDHVFFDGEDPLTRPVSVGLGIVRVGNVLHQSTR